MLKLRIVSPEKVIFDGEIIRLKVPGSKGEFEVLNNHAPIISTLSEGMISYQTLEGEFTVTIFGGFIEVQNNNVSLCVEVQ